MRRSAFRRRTGDDALSHLCSELSEVINRVRAIFGPVPMGDVAVRPEIKMAEQAVNLEARRLQRGEGDPVAWHRALDVYEMAWIAALKELQRTRRRAS